MGGNTRIHSGSYVDAAGISLITCLSLGQALSSNRLMTLGLFPEFGSGDYDTYDSFSITATVKWEATPIT
jgi:hypothetical protein